jgi:hypothetical protein
MSLFYWKTQDEPTMIYQLQPSKQLCKNTALESVHAKLFTLSLAWLFIKTGAEVLMQLLRTFHNKRHAISREKALPWIFPYTVKMKEGNNESGIHQLCDSYCIANRGALLVEATICLYQYVPIGQRQTFKGAMM